ncbi:hypothetical protein E4U49_005140 [Claviceps purpurea]|nr:hypothetical protein E4U49_005140 [Claviceps purpurea]
MVSGPLVWLSGLAVLVARAAAAAAGDDVVTSDTFFYGQSPAVYPSPEITGGSEWATAHGKAKALVAKMSLLERVSLTGGAFSKTGYSGTIAPIPRLNFSGMCLSDSGNGLRNMIFWNKALTRKRGAAMGGEFGRKGVNVFLGPVVGPAGRTVRGGRNWEGFSTDPYLSGCLAARTIEGVQSEGVQTSLKALSGWRARWHRRTANIMCSYQRVNNSYGCANSKTLNGLLKTELGFQSDWDAQRAGVAAALAGMDVAMPSLAELWGKYLVEAVKNGFVPESRVTDMAARILTVWYQFGQDTKFPNPGFGMPHSMIAFWNPTNRSKAEIGKTGPPWKATCWSRIPKEPYPCDLRDRFPCSDTRPDPPGADVLAPSADEVSLDMWRYGQTSA